MIIPLFHSFPITPLPWSSLDSPHENSLSISAQFTEQIAESPHPYPLPSLPLTLVFRHWFLSLLLPSPPPSRQEFCFFPKPFLRGTTSFPAGLSCAVQKVWLKADTALLPQRLPPPSAAPTASNCMPTQTQFLTQQGGKMKIQWLVLKFENQHYNIKILSLLIMYTKCSHQSKLQLPMSQYFCPELAATYTTDLKPLQNLKNRNHILWEMKSKIKICL